MWLPGIRALLGLNKIDQFVSIFSLKSIDWEVFRNNPWEVYGVLSNQIHSVNMTPDIEIFDLK